MNENIFNFFSDDEKTVLSEIDKEILEKVQDLPMELQVENERIGEVADE